MLHKKKIILFFCICCWITLTSWMIPYLSRQQHVPDKYESKLLKLKNIQEEKKEIKKKEKKALQKHYKSFYVAHQKNRLAYFDDHDSFIWFYDENNKYTYFLSNFYPTNVKIWDMKFSCSEAAFQAAKFLHKPEIAVRFTHLDGHDAWKLAQKLSYQQRGDWYHIRKEIMAEVLRTKFKEHSELAELLLATGEAYLVEHSSRDAFWTDGGDGKGKNMLGNVLMRVRGELGGIGVVSKSAKYKKFINKD